MQIRKKGMSFIGALTLMVTLVSLHQFFLVNISQKNLLMIIVYICIALVSDDYSGIINMVERIWSINDNGDEDDEKLQLIKSFTQHNVVRWVKYWNLYGEIVNGDEKHNKIKTILYKIPNGRINIKQFLWILSYIMYAVYFPDTLLGLGEEFCFFIDLVGLSFFIFTGSSVIGMETFVTNIFEAIKPVKDKTVRQSLQSLESEIIYGGRQYGFFKNKINLKRGEVNDI